MKHGKPPTGAHKTARVFLVEQRGRFMVGTPAFGSGPPVDLGKENRFKLSEGDLCAVLKPVHFRRKQKPPVIQRIGSITCAQDIIKAVLIEHEQRQTFSRNVEHDAAKAVAKAQTDHARRDLRELPTFTIDPADAKDFDDAISAQERKDGKVRVWVHIADVSAFVRPGSPTDKAAQERGTSLYFPGGVISMLPETLCNDACSLKPNSDRCAVTVEMEMREEEIIGVKFYRSLIRSDCRLSYEDVDKIFAGEKQADALWADSLAAARKAARGLAKRFSHGGALDIETSEPQFQFDQDGVVTAGISVPRTESHILIERLMITANEQVALFLELQHAPALYRIHERPEPESVERIIEQLEALSIPTPPIPQTLSPSEANELLGAISRAIRVYTNQQQRGSRSWPSLVLRATKRACYSAKNFGHSGLGLTHYCHFTSPIRRYPDIVCHRALLAALSAGETSPDVTQLSEQADWLSFQEREAEKIERKTDRVASAFLLLDALGEERWDTVFEGEVTGMIKAGVFVMFNDIFEGFIPIRRLAKNIWWELDESGVVLHGKPKGTIALGDPIKVKVNRIDRLLGKIDLERV